MVMIVKFKIIVFLLCLASMSRCIENGVGELFEVDGINENSNSVVFGIGSGINSVNTLSKELITVDSNEIANGLDGKENVEKTEDNVESLAFLGNDDERSQESLPNQNADNNNEALDGQTNTSDSKVDEQTLLSNNLITEEEDLAASPAENADLSQTNSSNSSTSLREDFPLVNANNIENNCLTQCVERCDSTYSNAIESKECKIKSCLCDESIISISDTKTGITDNTPESEKYHLASIFLNCLVGLSILFLTASLIMLCLIISKNRNSNLNNSQYDTLNIHNSYEYTENNYKVLDEKLVENELYDSKYELMTTEIDDDERISIRDF